MRVMGLVVTVVTTAQGVMAQQVSAAAVDVLFAVAGAVMSSTTATSLWLSTSTTTRCTATPRCTATTRCTTTLLSTLHIFLGSLVIFLLATDFFYFILNQVNHLKNFS